ncbi:MAG TPA: MFS transporter [Actinomycetota bacterium]|nr:MFS transporter [Actinomycetota bacterium]
MSKDPSDPRLDDGSRTADEAVPPSPLRRPEFRRLLAISITVALGFGMVIPVLPLLAESFGVSLAAIGLVQLVFGLTRFSFGIVGGLVVDRFGDRAATMAGLLIVALSSYAAGFSTTFPQLVLARGFGGAGSALFIGGLMNRILRIIEPEAMGRATGAFRGSFLVGIGAGPVLGGLVADAFGVAAPFHFYATGLLVATVIAYIVMGGAEAAFRSERRSPVEALRAAKPLLGDLRYVVALAATFVGWWTISGPGQIIGVVYAKNRLELSPDQIGLAITMLAVGEIAILWVAGRASDRYGRRSVLVPSLGVVAAAAFLLGQIESVPIAFFPLMALIGAGVAAGGTAIGGLLADSIPEGGSGAAVGVNQMVGDLGYLTAPTVLGAAAETSFDYEGAYLLGAVPALVVFFLALRLPRYLPGRPASAREDPVEPHEPVG